MASHVCLPKREHFRRDQKFKVQVDFPETQSLSPKIIYNEVAVQSTGLAISRDPQIGLEKICQSFSTHVDDDLLFYVSANRTLRFPFFITGFIHWRDRAIPRSTLSTFSGVKKDVVSNYPHSQIMHVFYSYLHYLTALPRRLELFIDTVITCNYTSTYQTGIGGNHPNYTYIVTVMKSYPELLRTGCF